MAPALLLATGAEVVPGESRPSSGLTVVLPATSARDLIARSRDGRVLVHGLILDQGQADTLHGEVAAVKASGLVSTSVRDGQPVLPYAEDMVDELVIDREALVDKTPAQAEIDRVLISRFGVARIREKGAWNDYRRPMPATYGEWTHYFHDATNNPVGEDNVATIATGVRWIADGQANGGSFQLVGGGRLIHFNREVRSNFTGCGGQTWATTRVQNAFNGLPLWETSAANWKEEYTQRYDRAVIDDDRLIHLRTRKGQMVATSMIDGTELMAYDVVTITPNLDAVKIPATTGGDVAAIAIQERRNLCVTSGSIFNAADADSGKSLWRFTAPAGSHLGFPCLDRTTGTIIVAIGPLGLFSGRMTHFRPLSSPDSLRPAASSAGPPQSDHRLRRVLGDHRRIIYAASAGHLGGRPICKTDEVIVVQFYDSANGGPESLVCYPISAGKDVVARRAGRWSPRTCALATCAMRRRTSW